MGFGVCFHFWQGEECPIPSLSTTIPSVRFDLAILWTVSSLTCPSLRCHNARDTFDVIWLWVMFACADLIISTLSLYRFLSWLAQATSFPEVVWIMSACLGVRMVVMPMSPILVTDRKDSLRVGRCKTSLNIPPLRC